MPQETEIKLRIMGEEEARRVEKRCRSLSAKNVTRMLRDEYYDTADEQLRQGDLTVRIRKIDDVVLIALKGPRVFGPHNIHRRLELEVETQDEDALREQLGRQGLLAHVVIEKRRTEFAVDECQVAIDILPFIGWFVEVEGPDSGAIEKVTADLGLSTAASVMENYTELLEKEFVKLNRPVRPGLIATFDTERNA